MEKAKAYIKSKRHLEELGMEMDRPVEMSTKDNPVSSLNEQTGSLNGVPSFSKSNDVGDNVIYSQGQSAVSEYSYSAQLKSPCYVCGGSDAYEPLLIRPDPDNCNKPYFPFLQRHEAPTGVPQVSANQTYVMACMLCFRSLNEQWNSYERQNKPHIKRIYHMKRVDNKDYIGADISTQGEFVAQMFGLSAENLSQNGLCERTAFDEKELETTKSQLSAVQQQKELTPACQSRPETPNCSFKQRICDESENQLSRPQSHENDTHSQIAAVPRPTSSLGTKYDHNIKPSSSFAQHKFKLGQISQVNSLGFNTYGNPHQQLNTTTQSIHYQAQVYEKAMKQLGMSCHTSNEGHKQQSPSGTSDFQVNSCDDTSMVLDLRNSTSDVVLSNAKAVTNSPKSAMHIALDVGILDLSMPDKNSTTEVCYVCGDEQRRGSLIELNTVKPKEHKDRNPYFPIFNEQHPRPARSRPKDPRGMIQACRLCYNNLIQQWNNHLAMNVQEKDRTYTLRKRLDPLMERTAFVCYTCGCDRPSSQLRLVYCCPNAENEPYYPFIRSIKIFKNASPISPQGMVQICLACYDKHSHLAERNCMGNAESETVNTSCGVMSKPNSRDNGINRGIEKSHMELSGVKFKPYELNLNAPSGPSDTVANKGHDSRPNTPASLQGASEKGLIQYPCYICKVMCPANKMEWLSTSAEHMNSHAMHFPCLKDNRNNNNNNNKPHNVYETLNHANNSANDNQSNRVLACKDCVNHLSRQWDTMDAERVPLEQRRYVIPSPMPLSNSPNESRNAGLISNTSTPSTPATSTPATTSIYCFLCGLHSDLTLARIVYASKEGSRPYFPHLLKHISLPNAEQLRQDCTALVCTFCYHSLLNQWRKFEAQNPAINPADRKYNWHDYICHLCGITTYRKRVRALPINEFPFVKNRKCDDGLLLENGDYAVVCLDCYESLRQQASQHDRFGVPFSRRAYNWVPQPPPPEDSPEATIARLPCGERSDRVQKTIVVRNNSSKKNNALKQCDKSKELPLKSGQKHTSISPAPPLAAPHHIAHSGPNAINTALVTIQNPAVPTNQISITPQHPVNQQVIASAAQGQQQLNDSLNAASNSARGPFASALRNLAKQADIKEDDEASARERNERSISQCMGQSPAANSDERCLAKKRPAPSSPPAEKIARLNPGQSTTAQSELLARSGFQPYRSDERLINAAAASFPMDSYATFAGLPGMTPAFLNPAYSEQLYLDQRYLLRAAGGLHPHAHPMYSPYTSHLYSMLPGAALGLGSAIHERMKLEEEHRARIAREEERERENQREKERERELRERKEQEQREKEQREREQREKEQRERELKEKETREKELREKERESREREREARDRERQQFLSASHSYTNQIYSPLNRTLLGSMMPHLNLGLRPPHVSLHGIPHISHYHAPNTRQSPHSTMGLNLGLQGIPGVPSISHCPSNIPHHLQQAALGLSHPTIGLGHPGFSTAPLGLTHHNLNLPHPHMSPHLTSTHMLPQQSPNANVSSSATSTSHNIQILSSSSNSVSKISDPTNANTSSISLPTNSSITSSKSPISSHIPSMKSSLYYGMHGSQPLTNLPNTTNAHLQTPISLPQTVSNSNTVHSSSLNVKSLVPSQSSLPSNWRTSRSPETNRHQVTTANTSDMANSNQSQIQPCEITSLDLTGSNSNSNPTPTNSSENNPNVKLMSSYEVNPNQSNLVGSVEKSRTKDLQSNSPQSPKPETRCVNISQPNITSESINDIENILPTSSVEKSCNENAKGISYDSTTTTTKSDNCTESMEYINAKNKDSYAVDETNGKFVVNSSMQIPSSSPSSMNRSVTEEKSNSFQSNPANSAKSPHLLTSPDAGCLSGVTSTTSGTTPPPVVSSSTNIFESPPKETVCDEMTASSAHLESEKVVKR